MQLDTIHHTAERAKAEGINIGEYGIRRLVEARRLKYVQIGNRKYINYDTFLKALERMEK